MGRGRYVPRAYIDKRYLDRPYYIAPNGKTGAEAFVVIRDAMQDEERVALGSTTFPRLAAAAVGLLGPFDRLCGSLAARAVESLWPL
jgi:non-homologous end joining protein Ku